MSQQLQKVSEAPSPITSLVCYDGVLLASVSGGQLAHFNRASSSLQLLLDTHGGPRGLAVDGKTGDLFFTDAVRKAVVKLESASPAALWDALRQASSSSSDGTTSTTNSNSVAAAVAAQQVWQQAQLRSFIDSFMDAPLKGPHGIAFDSKGEIYVSDPGAFGDTGLCSPHGSVLRTIANCQQVVPLAPTGLAYPAGVAVHGKTGAVFICELATNRLLRFVPRVPGGGASAVASTFGSVFHQFSGGMGPIAVAVDSEADMVYVAKYDFASAHSSSSTGGAGGVRHSTSSSTDADSPTMGSSSSTMVVGEVVVLYGSTGEEAGRFSVPGVEITAVAVDSVNRALYIAEGNSLYSAPLTA